jgi:hypothetical protein
MDFTGNCIVFRLSEVLEPEKWRRDEVVIVRWGEIKQYDSVRTL